MNDALPIADASAPATPATPAVSTTPADPLLIDGRRFAAEMTVSAATFARMKAAGKLPRQIELSSGCHRWLLSEVRAWIEASCPPLKEWEARKAASRRQHTGR